MNNQQFQQVPVTVTDLPTTVRGFVTTDQYGDPVIVLNARMTAEQRQKTFRHEMDHIERGDLWNEEYDEYGDAI